MLFQKKKKTISQLRREVEHEEAVWNASKGLLERREQVRKEKRALFGKKFKINKITTSKLLILFLFINCTLIEIFTGWATIKMLTIAMVTGLPIDFTPLVTLIGAVVGEVIGFAVYCAKAIKENTIGGIVYDKAMANNDEEAVG